MRHFAALLLAASIGCGSSVGSGRMLTDAGTSCVYPADVPFFACERQKCATELANCFGKDWQNDSFSDLCRSYVTCKCGCASSDIACGNNCSTQASSDCTACLNYVAQCSQRCAP